MKEQYSEKLLTGDGTSQQDYEPIFAGKDLKKKKVLLKFDDVRFSVIDKAGNNRDILNGLSGFVRQSELVAIMGSSGAGKTTLFNIVSGRQASNKSVKVSGKLNVQGNEYDLGPEEIIYDVAYVMQMDLLPPTSTVFEMFRFSAKLRLPAHFDERVIQERANEMCEVMGLMRAKDSLIGDEKIPGISGGQKKRVSVGTELIPDPDFLFLDEPTTGLDSHTALALVKTFRKLAKKGHVVIVVIHQPSAAVFYTFDTLWLLSRGKFVYNGSTADCANYFQEIGYANDEGQNIADHLISCIYFDETDPEESELLINYFIDTWTKESAKRTSQESIEVKKIDPLKSKRSTVRNLKGGTRPGWIVQTIELAKRELMELVRNPAIMRVRLAQTIFTGILAGIVFFGLGKKYRTGLKDRLGGVFFLVLNNGMAACSNNVLNFPQQRLVFERERKNVMYNTIPYLTAKNLVQIVEFILPILSVSIVKPMMDLQGDWGTYYLVALLITFTSGAMGMSIGALAPSSTVAVQMMPAALIPLILMCGYFVTLESVENWLSWIGDINFFRYAFEALTMAEFKDQWYECEPNTCNAADVNCVRILKDNILEYSGNCYIEGERNLDPDNKGLWILLIFVFGMVYKLCGCGVIIRNNGV